MEKVEYIETSYGACEGHDNSAGGDGCTEEIDRPSKRSFM